MSSEPSTRTTPSAVILPCLSKSRIFKFKYSAPSFCIQQRLNIELFYLRRLVASDSDVWGIDGTVLQYGDGQLYYIWSGWPTYDAGFPQNLYIAKMSDPMHLTGPRALLREPRSGWESIGARLNEGPQVLQHNGRTFVIFSASGSWTADYCLGMIGIDGLKDPMNPANWWQDVDQCVFWRNDAQNVFGVGHASFTTSPGKWS